MPFRPGGKSLTSSLQLPSAGIIVAQEAPLHAYYTMANEIQETNRQWEAARAQVNPQMASGLAEMAARYPDLPASVLTGAAAAGLSPQMPAFQALNDRIAYSRTVDPIGTTATNLLEVPFDFIRGGVRIATTAFDAIYQEIVSRPVRIGVGLSQGMSMGEAVDRSGSSAGTRALGRFFADPIGNLTPLPSSPEGRVNLGSGWLPGSNMAESDSAEVQMLMQMGVPEANAIAQVQQQYGDPVTHLAREQAETGITFQSGMSISPGRLVAKTVGIEEGTMPFHIVSGAADFGSQIFLDPTNLALWGLGKARLANKMLIGGGTRRKVFGVHVDDYLQSPDYHKSNEVLANMHINEDVANALNVDGMSGGIEGFSTRKLVADVVNSRTAQEVDNVRRPYFGASDTEGLPMVSQVPTPRSIMNPSGSRRTMGQVLGGQFSGAAGEVGGTFGLKAAVKHNLEGTWAGRMFSRMPGAVIVTDNLDEGYHQLRAWLNSADLTPEESHRFLQEFAELTDGDGPGALAVINKAKKYFIENKIPGASDELKKGILKTWNRWEADRAFWTGSRAQDQWIPDVEVIGVVDDGQVVVSKASAQQVNELYNNAIPMPPPREIRNALSQEGLLRVGKYTSKEVKVAGTDTAKLTEQAWVNVVDGYMQKVWKPFVLMRVAWPVRVVFEEQLRMAAAGFDSMFSHPLSWFAYAFSGKMNKTLMGEALETSAAKGEKFTSVIDFRPNGRLDEFQASMAKGGGPLLDGGGRSPGTVKYTNVWRDEEGFADAWLWNLAKNHQDPVQSYLRTNGIDNTVDWLINGAGKPFLKQLVETSNPIKSAFLGKTLDDVSAARLRWYVEGLHARSVALQGGDYVYWNPHVTSGINPSQKGGWMSSGDTPLSPQQLDELGLDPLGPPDPGPIPGRGFSGGGDGPQPTDGLPDPGQSSGPTGGGGPSGTDPFNFDTPEVQPMPRRSIYDQPLSGTDVVQTTLDFSPTAGTQYSTMGWQMNSGGYDPSRAFASLWNELNLGRASDIEASLFDEDFSTINRVLDDIYELFNDGTGKVDDDRLTAAFNTWANTMVDDVEGVPAVAEQMVWLLNQRHQQQLDLLNYVYPGRLSLRSEALEALTDAQMWGGIKLLVDDLTPEQTDELRFIHRFIDSLSTNETSWGRDANKLIDYVFDNYGNEFLSINRDSRVVNRLKNIGESQADRTIMRLDEVPSRPMETGSGLGGPKFEAEPIVVKGYVHADEAGNVLSSRGVSTTQEPGMIEASVTLRDYETVDLTELARDVSAGGQQAQFALRAEIEEINSQGLSVLDARAALIGALEDNGLLSRGKTGQLVFQGPIDRSHPLLKGMPEEVLNLLDNLRGAYFAQLPVEVGGTMGAMPRIIAGGYDGVWSSAERAAFVQAAQESGAFTDQGAMSIARVIEVLQSRDAGMTRGWLDVLGREIATGSAKPAAPLDLMSLHELETATTTNLMDELLQLAHGFRRREVAANDVFKAVRPGAEQAASAGVEARLVDIADELSRRLNLADDMGPEAFDAMATQLSDQLIKYAELEEVPVEYLDRIIEWMDEVASELDFVVTPTRATWPRAMIDEFDEASQPHLYGDYDAFNALPDDAEVWVFHGTDPLTARQMLVDGVNPVNKPIDKTMRMGDIAPGKGYDSAMFVTANFDSVYGYSRAASAGAPTTDTFLAVKVRKGDLRTSREYDELTDAARGGQYPPDEAGFYGEGALGYSLVMGDYGAVIDGAIPPGNIRMMSVRHQTARDPDTIARELLEGGPRDRAITAVEQNVKAADDLPYDAAMAVRKLEKRGYRVDVVSTYDEARPSIYITDRDRIVRIDFDEIYADPKDADAWLEAVKGGVIYEPPQSRPRALVTEYDPKAGGWSELSSTDPIDEVLAKVFPKAANSPRKGFWYQREMLYGTSRPKNPFRIHRENGNLVNFDELPINGGAKAELRNSLPDAPRSRGPGEPTPREPLALGEGPPQPALGAGEPAPPGGYASTGGVNDPNFTGTHYVITKGPDDEVRKMVDTGVARDPFTGEDMDLFPTGTIDNYASDMAGLPSRHMALNEYMESAPQTLPTPDPQYTGNQVGVWDKAIQTMFYYMMSVPTNKLSRAPVFKQAYLERILHLRSFGDDATKARVDKALGKDLGLKPSDLRRRNPVPNEFFSRGEAGKGVAMTFREMDQIAKGYALEATRNLLYDLSRKHDASDVLRNIFPFAEAWGEIITAWSKIMWENPRMFRRAQQGIEGAREQGWFYNDSYGQEVFAYPGSGFVTKAMLGLGGEDTDVRLTGQTAGVNLALGQYVPGFGPVVQVPASMLIPNMPKFDSVRKFLNPYGDVEVRTPGDILDLAFPAWYEKALIAIGTADPNYRRLHHNTVMDTYKILAAEHPERLNNAASSYALMEEASAKASGLSWVRAFAAFFSPTSPQIEYRVEDAEGTMWQMQTVSAEYYRLLRENDFDQQQAMTSFIQRFGWGDNLTEGLGIATAFVTPKSVKVEERSTTTTGYAWQRDNADLFEANAYPTTAAYAMQDVDWEEFDYTAYLEGLKEGTREPLTPQEWLMKRNELLGNIAYDVAAARVEGRTDRAASLWKRDMRLKLRNEYPGFDVDIAGLPQRADIDTKIMELERWALDPRLAESNAGQGVAVYLQLRRRAEAEAYNRGLMPDSWKSAQSMESWRNWMRASSDKIIEVFPEFGQLWFDIFRWELTEDESPEVLALGGMTF